MVMCLEGRTCSQEPKVMIKNQETVEAVEVFILFSGLEINAQLLGDRDIV